MEITKFGLSNFRVFKNHTDFELAPIMVLTGPNNSGKSSLTKALLLMNGNNEEINAVYHSNVKLNYFKGNHDLGNHTLTLNKKDDNTFFSFTFFDDYKFVVEIDNSREFKADYIITGKNNELIIAQLGAYFKINTSRLIEYFNDRLNYIYSSQELVPHYLDINRKKIRLLIEHLNVFSQKYWLIDIDLNSEIETDKPFEGFQNTENDTNGLDAKKEEFDQRFINTFSFDPELDKYLLDDGQMQELLIFLFKNITTVELSTDEIHFLIPTSSNDYSGRYEFFDISDIIYVNSLKEPLKRSYSKNDLSVFQSFVVEEINRKSSEIFNSDGDYIHRINIKDEQKHDTFNNRNKYELFVKKWLAEFNIGEELSYGYDEGNDIFFIKIDNKSLPEYGLGYSLIIHLLIALSREINQEQRLFSIKELALHFPVTYILEEPETGLHPAFQSKMAEMIVDIQKTFDVNLIIETHSEYLIRKLQYLTATEKLNTSKAVIYYFNNPKEIPDGEKQIKKIIIEKDGSLTDNFGPGFIDEATNLKFELLRLNKNQNN